MRSSLFCILFLTACPTSYSQDGLWTVTRSDSTIVDSLTLVAVSNDSLWSLRNNNPCTFPLADVYEIRNVRNSRVSKYLLWGALAGFPIGIIARATDASARIKDVSILPYYGEGILIGATAAGMFGWLLDQDVVYRVDKDSRIVKSIFLRTIIEDQERERQRIRVEDSIRAVEQAIVQNNRITLDFAVNPFAHSGLGWGPHFAVRAGYGYNISSSFALVAHLEYYQFSLVPGGGFTGLIPTDTKRHDVALYAGWLMAGFLEVGLGAYYSQSEKIQMIGLFQQPEPWSPSGSSSIRLFVTGGIQYEIHIVDGLYIPVGLYKRTTAPGDDMDGYILLRLGVEFKY
jgi:hypothetical protein